MQIIIFNTMLTVSLLSTPYLMFNRTLRREPKLTQFETAQIANLCPADAEEAKSIIPRYVHSFPMSRVVRARMNRVYGLQSCRTRR